MRSEHQRASGRHFPCCPVLPGHPASCGRPDQPALPLLHARCWWQHKSRHLLLAAQTAKSHASNCSCQNAGSVPNGKDSRLDTADLLACMGAASEVAGEAAAALAASYIALGRTNKAYLDAAETLYSWGVKTFQSYSKSGGRGSTIHNFLYPSQVGSPPTH